MKEAVDADDHPLIIINFTTSKKEREKREQRRLMGMDADGH